MDASFLEVDVAAIRRNYRRLRDLVGPQTRICPVIKGNAYGMGATEVGRVLQQREPPCWRSTTPTRP